MAASARPRLIFGKLFLLGVLAVGMILGSVFWFTSRIDQLERQGAENIVQLLVTEKVAHIQASTADYAHWTLAYELVAANDEAGLRANIALTETDHDLFDHIIILDADSRVLHVYGSSGAIDPAGQFDPLSVQPFLSKLRDTNPADYVTVSGIGQINGLYAAIGATRITPDYFARIDGARLPIMVTLRLFTDDVLQTLADMTHGAGFAIVPLDGEPREPAVDLSGPDGAPVARLVWSQDRLGTALREDVMPLIVLACLGIFGFCLSAARYFHQQSKALERAMVVASTDKLTGLLNRSGLDEVLRKADARSYLDAGHLSVLYLDLNDFKKLNDEHGHEDGDHALKTTAKRLRESVRPRDHVVRLGGDEFICVVFDQSPGAAARSVSDRILIACNQPIVFAGHETILTPSLGVAVAEPGMSWDALLGRADQAMYQAKRNKQTTAVFFSSAGTAKPRDESRDKTNAA